jgi:hypothetical protein
MTDTSYFGDTPLWQSAEMVKLWQRLSLDQRAEKLGNMIQAGRELMIEGVKLRAPHLTAEEARHQMKELLYTSYKNNNA